MSFKIENIQEENTINQIIYNSYTASSPAFGTFTNNVLPYTLSFTGVDEDEILLDKQIIGNNFVQTPGNTITNPAIAGNYITTWSFTSQLKSGTPGIFTAKMHNELHTTDINFTFPVSNTASQTSITGILQSTKVNDDFHFSITSNGTGELDLLSNIVNISYQSS